MLWRSGLPCQEVALTPRLFLKSGDSETSSSGIFEMATYRKPDFSGPTRRIASGSSATRDMDGELGIWDRQRQSSGGPALNTRRTRDTQKMGKAPGFTANCNAVGFPIVVVETLRHCQHLCDRNFVPKLLHRSAAHCRSKAACDPAGRREVPVISETSNEGPRWH
jgi:hypothetical protein